MIWVSLATLAAVALAPLAFGLLRGARARGRRDADIALYRGQLAELDRDLAEGRIAGPDHATATLEVQRRLLAAADAADPLAKTTRRWPLYTALGVVPIAALALYLVNGAPYMPDAPLAARRAQEAQEQALIDKLRGQLAHMDPASEQTRHGYVILGNVEEERANHAAAADAYRTALAMRFDALLALQIGEILARESGKVTPESADYFRKALAAAPEDAPWRKFAEERLKEAEP